jgi:organic hydroperoxide reductase OsmC/OhrA
MECNGSEAQHDYVTRIAWTGNRGEGTRRYLGYDRTWDMQAKGKAIVACSNDPLLGGDPGKYNPEDLLLSALSACHMLWYLHLASEAGVIVHSYRDEPLVIGENEKDGTGRFLRAELRPHIELETGTDPKIADLLHHQVHHHCFIARSVAFPVTCKATYELRDAAL